MHCPFWSPGQPDCSGKGMCVSGHCFCAAGWGKLPGKVGPNICADPTCPVDCGKHGMCLGNMCVCQEGWQGPACRLPKCSLDCAGHGTCSFTAPDSAPECKCDYGWALPDCARPAFFMMLAHCPNDCSGNGLCFNGKCVCNEMYVGPDCGSTQCQNGLSGPDCMLSSCPRDCGGKGLCFNGQCTCDNGHAGPDCSIPTRCYDACADICLRDLQSAQCEFCKGQCLTLADHLVLGRHDPLIDRFSTLEITPKRDMQNMLTSVATPSDTPASRVLTRAQ